MYYHAGARHLSVADKELGISFPMLLLYPTEIPARELHFGPLSVKAVLDAPTAGGTFPLVMISHGGGGFHLGYLTLAQFLAEQGYVVAMPEHYKNNRNDNSLNDTDENLQLRPKHISLSVNTLFHDSDMAPHIQADNIAVIGHSMGGYTALALAGGKVWNARRERLNVISDKRIKALVLLAPATEWFTPAGSLDEVNLPVLMLTAEHDDPFFPPGWHRKTADIVIDQLDKSQISFEIVNNSGHLSFLSPFPEAMKKPGYLPAMDPADFDREAFHRKLNREILVFLTQAMSQERPGSE